MRKRSGLILASVCAALAVAIVATVYLSRASDWQPAALVGLLLVLCIGSDVMTVEVRNVRITGSFLAIVLAMALLGPAPAAVIGASASLVDAIVARRPIDNALMNIANYMIFPLIGGVAIHATVGPIEPDGSGGLNFAALVLPYDQARDCVLLVGTYEGPGEASRRKPKAKTDRVFRFG